MPTLTIQIVDHLGQEISGVSYEIDNFVDATNLLISYLVSTSPQVTVYDVLDSWFRQAHSPHRDAMISVSYPFSDRLVTYYIYRE